MAIAEVLWEELTAGIPDVAQFVRVAFRLVMAMLLGAVVGFNRERTGKPAGLRTHMLVALGAALFVLVAEERAVDSEGVSRVVQGVATGIGFLGAGAILKSSQQGEIKGLTTAAGIWLTAAVGVAAGLGSLGAAILTVVLAWVILAVFDKLSEHIAASPASYDMTADSAEDQVAQRQRDVISFDD